jgi:hypothetical protein
MTDNNTLREALEMTAWQLEEVAAPHMREYVPGALAIQCDIKAKKAREALSTPLADNKEGEAIETENGLLQIALDSLQRCKRLFEEALPQFDWGKSALNANAIQLLNQVPVEVDRTLALAMEPIAPPPDVSLLVEALKWALPLAVTAMETHRLGRVQAGHTDITGTYKNGVTWVGIYQDEVDAIERARTALNTYERTGK